MSGYFLDPITICGSGFGKIHKGKSEVRVHNLGTNDWRRIQDFPFSCPRVLGIFVSGTLNWLTSEVGSSSRVIVSLDLEKESFQKLPQPDLDEYGWSWTLGVLRECLCIFANSVMFMDVWVMKEYRNKESWTKLYHVSHMENQGLCGHNNALNIFNNDQFLMDCYEFESCKNELKWVVYDSKNGTWKIIEIQNIHCWMNPKVYIERV